MLEFIVLHTNDVHIMIPIVPGSLCTSVSIVALVLQFPQFSAVHVRNFALVTIVAPILTTLWANVKSRIHHH